MGSILEAYKAVADRGPLDLAFRIMRAGCRPYDLGEVTIWWDDNTGLWPDYKTIALEFKKYPAYNFRFSFSEQEKLYAIGDPDRLGFEFGMAWVEHYRKIRVEPESNIYLGEE